MSARAVFLLALHVGAGCLVVMALARHLVDREREIGDLARTADAEHRQTLLQERQVEVQRNLLDGLRQGDPFVIEWIAREQHGYHGPHEVMPKPLPQRAALIE